MRGNEFLDKMELADAAFVAEADQLPARNRRGWMKWGAAAACFCFVVIGAFFFWESNIAHQSAPYLEKIDVSEFRFGNFGFEGYLYYDDSELVNDNPWNENMEISTLPVYRFKTNHSSDTIAPKGLNEKEIRSLLKSTASALGIKIISTEVFPEDESPEDREYSPLLRAIFAKTNHGEIRVFATGEITYHLPDDDHLVLPDKYSFTYNRTTNDEAYEAIAYLSDFYKKLLHKVLDYKTLTAATWGSYNIYGEYHRDYYAYDSSGNDIEDIINYNLRRVSFCPAEDGKLFIVRISDELKAAKKIGDYPIVSVDEAKQRLLAGNYHTSVPYAMPGEEYIAKAELIYSAGFYGETLLPYYRFYVFLPEQIIVDGLKTYGAYYVPAISDEYIINMPVDDEYLID